MCVDVNRVNRLAGVCLGAPSSGRCPAPVVQHVASAWRPDRTTTIFTGNFVGLHRHRRGPAHRCPHGHGHPGAAVPDVSRAKGGVASPGNLVPDPGRLRPDGAGARIQRPGAGDLVVVVVVVVVVVPFHFVFLLLFTSSLPPYPRSLSSRFDPSGNPRVRRSQPDAH